VCTPSAEAMVGEVCGSEVWFAGGTDSSVSGKAVVVTVLCFNCMAGLGS
jgi:hypothetical protein